MTRASWISSARAAHRSPTRAAKNPAARASTPCPTGGCPNGSTMIPTSLQRGRDAHSQRRSGRNLRRARRANRRAAERAKARSAVPTGDCDGLRPGPRSADPTGSDQPEAKAEPLSVTKSIAPHKHGSALFILEGADNDQNEIDQHPDAEAAECYEFKDARSDLADIEAVDSQHADQKAQQQSNQAKLGARTRRRHLDSGRSATMRAAWRQTRNDLAAATAKLLVGGQRRHGLRHNSPSPCHAHSRRGPHHEPARAARQACTIRPSWKHNRERRARRTIALRISLTLNPGRPCYNGGSSTLSRLNARLASSRSSSRSMRRRASSVIWPSCRSR